MNAGAWQPPRRIDAVDFWLRSRLLATAHALREALRPSARRWPGGAQALADAPVLAQYRTALWSDGRDDEFPLVAGKVQNLRVARRAFDAVEVPAGEVLVTKCCLFEDRNEVDVRTVLTPWGASFGELRDALATAVTLATTQTQTTPTTTAAAAAAARRS